LECLGPVTVSKIVSDLGIDAAAVQSALEALEGEGFALRGRFTEQSPDAELEWCERRLLARIHRLTLEGLRQQIRPVEVADFVAFLLEYQHLTDATRLEGRQAFTSVIEQLQGFEVPAGAWEHELFPGRLKDYDVRWLDELSLGGHVAWGRLAPPRKADDGAPSRAGMTRVVPISLAFRDDMAWLVPQEVTPESSVLLRSGARAVLDALTSRGALFPSDLQSITGLLPTQLEDALGELAALGLVTADGFAAIRGIVSRGRSTRIGTGSSSGVRRLARWGRLASRSHSSGGRWSLFARPAAASRPDERAERWAWQLLRRYGIVFRDLLARESLAPRWRDLLPAYRRLEARGEIRGGRFVAGVAGEQFAITTVVDQLRRVRELNERRASSPQDASIRDTLTVISACDPANVFGVVTPGKRIAATRRNRLAVQQGRLIASLEAGVITVHDTSAAVSHDDVQRLMRQSAATRMHQAFGAGGHATTSGIRS
jgi:ATP-dependent Lhr-like helicase